jgi:hypothetical protein
MPFKLFCTFVYFFEFAITIHPLTKLVKKCLTPFMEPQRSAIDPVLSQLNRVPFFLTIHTILPTFSNILFRSFISSRHATCFVHAYLHDLIFPITSDEQDQGLQNSPTAGDMERDPVDPVGDGVGLMPWELGVPGAGPLELSLLFWPVRSCKTNHR